jgi:uncharacterized DUF497 family protein
MFLHPQLIGLPFVFDTAKDLANQLKHGISLRLAEFADWNAARLWPDTRRDYGEPRWICLVPIDARLHVAVVVPRGCALRVISLRKANNREIYRYDQDR